MSHIITADWLREQGACNDQVAIVAREWPVGARITRKNLSRAAMLQLDIHWLAQFLDTKVQCKYTKNMAPAGRRYDKAVAAAWRRYEKAALMAWFAHEKTEVAFCLYNKTATTAWRVYREARVTALANALGLP